MNHKDLLKAAKKDEIRRQLKAPMCPICGKKTWDAGLHGFFCIYCKKITLDSRKRKL